MRHARCAFLAVLLTLTALPAHAQEGTVEICLATADGRLVPTRVARDQLDVYRNGRNIVPAPAEGCPTRVESERTPRRTTTTEITPDIDPELEELAERELREQRRRERGQGGGSGPARTTSTTPARELARTGAEPLTVAALGAALLLLGLGLRLRTAPLRF